MYANNIHPIPKFLVLLDKALDFDRDAIVGGVINPLPWVAFAQAHDSNRSSSMLATRGSVVVEMLVSTLN